VKRGIAECLPSETSHVLRFSFYERLARLHRFPSTRKVINYRADVSYQRVAFWISPAFNG
jgi:hypothetical protein